MLKPLALCIVASVAAIAAIPALACGSMDEPRPFTEVLRAAKSAAVVRVERIRTTTKPPTIETGDIQWVEPTGIPAFKQELEADVRVAETLFGERALISRIEFSANRCGGHHLDVGEYYVILSETNGSTATLGPREESILALNDEYDESAPDLAALSLLLMELRDFARDGQFPDAARIRDHLAAKPYYPPIP